MSLQNNTKFANRLGLNLKFYDYADGAVTPSSTPVATIDFVNETSLELSSDINWATGGQGHFKMIGFPGAIEGTFTINSQVNTLQLLALAAGNDLSTLQKKVSFKNSTSGNAKSNFYVIKGETVYVGEDGATYSEEVTLYKACVKPGYSVTWNGDGDPQSISIEFELGADANGNVADLDFDDASQA